MVKVGHLAGVRRGAARSQPVIHQICQVSFVNTSGAGEVAGGGGLPGKARVIDTICAHSPVIVDIVSGFICEIPSGRGE